MIKKRAFRNSLVLMIIAVLVGGLAPKSSVSNGQVAYIEPGLLASLAETLSVIVTADDAETAARAVKAVDGQVSSELWLIDAVAATVTANRLADLAAIPGIVSVVDNKGVQAAQLPEPDDSTGWDGWVTDYRCPVPWDGSPDAEPTSNKGYYHIINPIPIDLGAVELHRQYFFYGFDVTVAILDSGVYIIRSDQVRTWLQT